MAVINTNMHTARSGDFQRARKTVAFDGTAGNGAVGTVTVFTVTGTVFIQWITAFCTEDLAEAAPTATLATGTAGDVDAFYAQVNATDIDASDWLPGNVGIQSATQPATGGVVTHPAMKVINENVILTVGAQDISNGTIVFDVKWKPISDGATLV